MVAIMKKIREDLKTNKDAKVSRLPSLNPDTPPLIVIKSHIMHGPREKMADIMKKLKDDRDKNESNIHMSVKSHVKSPMSIKSHIISAP